MGCRLRLKMVAHAFLAFIQVACATAAVNVHIVPHTHDDVGWLKTVDEYYSGRNNSIQHAVVRSILTSVQQSLAQDPTRRFTYVEQAFFQRWWREQSEASRELTRSQVRNGQLNFVNGGWCMHDEAATHYVAMVDQTTLGHRLLKDQFGDDGIPTVGWQLDPFGHSSTQAALLSADAGFDALYFGRIDYQDLELRNKERRAEFIWRASPSLGPDAQVFAGLTGEYGGNYGAPAGFNWDIRSNDEPVEDNENLQDHNVASRVEDFVKAALDHANRTRGEHVMWTMGSDFEYECAESWYANLDKIIKYVNQDGRVKAFYSSPADYTKAKFAEAAAGTVTWPVDSGDNADFFPYADGPHQFWTGYFTSRPALKRYVRENVALFNSMRQLQALAQGGGADPLAQLQTFEEALGVAQHHDGVSGTAKQHVTFDYAQRIAKGYGVGMSVLGDSLDTLLLGGAKGAWTRCMRLNETVCAQTQQASGSVTVSLWNPTAQARTETVRVPVSGATVSVKAMNGSSVASQTYPAGETVDQYARDTKEAVTIAAFQATIPPLASASFIITVGAQSADKSPKLAAPKADTILENDALKLTFDSTSGRVKSIANKITGTNTSLSQTFCYYEGNEGNAKSGQHSGAYIFRPKDDQKCHEVTANAAVEIVQTVGAEGDIVQEVRQVFSPWLTQTVRLNKGDRHAQFEFTVGPINLRDEAHNASEMACVSWRQTGNCDPDGPREPTKDLPCSDEVPEDASGFCECADGRKAEKSGCGHALFTCADACEFRVGKEVVSRFSTDIKSNGELWTDSNGREMMHRKRDFRPTWDFKQTEAVAGNYFPCGSAAAIRDANSQLTILVDRSQGVGSLTDGAMEFMVHRRLLRDDARGVGEPIDETKFVRPYTGGHSQGQHFGPGMVVRGTHMVSLEPPATAAAVWRPLADRVFSAVVLSLGSATGVKDVAAMATALPPNVQLMTLEAISADQILLRLSHQFGLGEHATLSKPATVDLGALFDPAFITIKAAEEVSLTNNQKKSTIMERRQRNAKWTQDGEAPHAWRTLPPLNFPAEPMVTLGPLEIKTFVLTV